VEPEPVINHESGVVPYISARHHLYFQYAVFLM